MCDVLYCVVYPTVSSTPLLSSYSCLFCCRCCCFELLLLLLLYTHSRNGKCKCVMEENATQQVFLEAKDIILGRGTFKSDGNDYLNKVVASYRDDYEAMPRITNKIGGPKQLLRKQIMNEMMAKGYRFVIGYKPNSENLSRSQKKKAPFHYVPATFEQAIKKVEGVFNYMRNRKVDPATNVIAKEKENIKNYFK